MDGKFTCKDRLSGIFSRIETGRDGRRMLLGARRVAGGVLVGKEGERDPRQTRRHLLTMCKQT